MTSAQLAKTALNHVTQVLEKLTDDQLQALANGHGWFEFRFEEVVVKSAKTRKAAAAPAFDVAEVADEIRAMATSAEIVSHLEAGKFKQADLVSIARALGPTVSTKGRVADLRKSIAEGVAGFRERAAAIGGWGRQ